MGDKPDPKKPTHHDFEEVIAWLRMLRKAVKSGTRQLIWRNHEVVFVKHEKGTQPGEPLE